MPFEKRRSKEVQAQTAATLRALQSLTEGESAGGKQRHSKRGKCHALGPENGQSCALQKNATADLQEVPIGDEVGELLHHPGHIVDREHEAREQYGRHQEEEGSEQRLLLGARDC